MKVKDFINIFKKTEFECTLQTYEKYSNSKVIDTEYKTFSLDFFGSAGIAIMPNTFVFEKEYEIIAKFANLNQLLNDDEIMEMEIIKIDEMRLEHYYNRSNNTKYYNNSSYIKFIVK